MSITCCKDCVPPKRQLGCHSKCEEYKKQKEENKARKKWLQENTYLLTKKDFNELAYNWKKINKRKKRR